MFHNDAFEKAPPVMQPDGSYHAKERSGHGATGLPRKGRNIIVIVIIMMMIGIVVLLVVCISIIVPTLPWMWMLP